MSSLRDWQHEEIALQLEKCINRASDTRKYYKKYMEEMSAADLTAMDKDLYEHITIAAKMLRASKLLNTWKTERAIDLEKMAMRQLGRKKMHAVIEAGRAVQQGHKEGKHEDGAPEGEELEADTSAGPQAAASAVAAPSPPPLEAEIPEEFLKVYDEPLPTFACNREVAAMAFGRDADSDEDTHQSSSEDTSSEYEDDDKKKKGKEPAEEEVWTEPTAVSRILRKQKGLAVDSPAVQTLKQYFDRYDLDRNGTVEPGEEHSSLTVNLFMGLVLPSDTRSHEDLLKASRIAEEGRDHPPGTGWDIREYADWFQLEFEEELQEAGIRIAMESASGGTTSDLY